MTKQLEPVCWLCSQEESLKIEWCKDDLPYWIRRGWDVEPLYTMSKRELLTDDVWKAYIKAIEDDSRINGCGLFILGVRFAEKHHGISPHCENS